MGPWPPCLAWVRPMGLANRYFHKCTDFRATVTCTIPTSSPTKAHRPHFWRCRELGCCQDERAERGCRAEWDRDLLQTPMDTHPHLLGLTQKPASPPPPPRGHSLPSVLPVTPASSFQLPQVSASILLPPIDLGKTQTWPSPPSAQNLLWLPSAPRRKLGFLTQPRRPCVLCSAPGPTVLPPGMACELSGHTGPHCLEGSERGSILSSVSKFLISLE